MYHLIIEIVSPEGKRTLVRETNDCHNMSESVINYYEELHSKKGYSGHTKAVVVNYYKTRN